MCYQSVCYSVSSIVDFECQDIIVKQPLLAIVAALFRSGSLVEFDLKSGKAQKEISILFFYNLTDLQWKNIFIGIYFTLLFYQIEP